MRRLLPILALGALATTAVSAVPDSALADTLIPKEARGVTIEPKFGTTVDTSTKFTDHRGADVTLGDYFKDGRPVLLTFNWYNCETLCSTQLNQLVKTLKSLEWTAGKDGFRIVTISIDPREQWELGRDKRQNYLDELGRGDIDWVFLVARSAIDTNVRALAQSVGFHYRYDEMADQYVHAAAVFVVTPDAKISHYLLGITYEPSDVRLSLIEASNGKLGKAFDKMLLGSSCFAYNAELGRYAAQGMDIMRFFGFLVMFVLGSILLVFWLAERSRSHNIGTLEA